MDVHGISQATGWRIHHYARTSSTNAEAMALRDAGAGVRVAVVADEQTQGRGRGGRSFASPAGGLYVSLLVGARPEDLPGALTAGIALAAAEAVERTSGVACGIKWPNDLWVDGRKLGGILLEAAGPALPVVAGIGLNLRTVPATLDASVRAATTALDEVAGRRVARTFLLEALLERVDQRLDGLADPAGRAALEAAWQARLALVGTRITYVHAGEVGRGRLLQAELDRGLLVEDDADGRVWRSSAHVRDVRPAG